MLVKTRQHAHRIVPTAPKFRRSSATVWPGQQSSHARQSGKAARGGSAPRQHSSAAGSSGSRGVQLGLGSRTACIAYSRGWAGQAWQNEVVVHVEITLAILVSLLQRASHLVRRRALGSSNAVIYVVGKRRSCGRQRTSCTQTSRWLTSSSVRAARIRWSAKNQQVPRPFRLQSTSPGLHAGLAGCAQACGRKRSKRRIPGSGARAPVVRITKSSRSDSSSLSGSVR